jgi:hypothetical protein
MKNSDVAAANLVTKLSFEGNLTDKNSISGFVGKNVALQQE